MQYDPFGRRIAKSSASGTSIYVYDGDNVIEELDGSGSVVARYSQGLGIDEPLAMYRGLVASYYESDGLSSITSLTNGASQLAASYVYDSFGKLTATTGSITNPFQYTSREVDSETGLYYYRARYYDSSVGRFLGEDPVSFKGADLNLYRFARNDPGNFTDPLGLLTIDPNFPSDCLPSLNRALNLLQGVAITDRRCNCAFRQIGSRRSLKELVDDPRITIHYSREEGTGEEATQVAYTNPGDTENITIRPFGCRMGRWALAMKLVHELTHITLVPQRLVQEDAAQTMEINCGFRIRVMPTTITVTPKP